MKMPCALNTLSECWTSLTVEKVVAKEVANRGCEYECIFRKYPKEHGYETTTR